MSYSSLNNAFNINSDFEKTIRGLNSFDPSNNTIENIKSSNNPANTIPQFESNYFGNCDIKGKNCNLDYQNNFYNPNDPKAYSHANSSFDPLPIIDGMYSGDDNMSWESLDGTDLYSRGDNVTYGSSSSNKLTHRECIKIYNNPDSYKDNILSHALKHVSKCKICKEEIKKSIVSDTNKKQPLNSQSSNSQSLNSQSSNSQSSNSQSSNSQSPLSFSKLKKTQPNNQDNLSLLSSYQNFHNPVNSGSLNLSTQTQSQAQTQSSNSKIESELKLLSEKINGETNLKYQNALIQNNISKYLEDLEERKKINNKLDNIIDMIKTEFISKQDNSNQNNYKSNINTEFKDTNILNLLTSTQFLSNLSKLNELNNLSNNSSNNSNSSYETYLLYTGIFIIIVLLIIDIILRFNTKTN